MFLFHLSSRRNSQSHEECVSLDGSINCISSCALIDALPDDPRVKVIAADAGVPSTLQEPLQGARAVFFAAQGRSYDACMNCDELGVKHVAEASKAQGEDRSLAFMMSVLRLGDARH